MSRPVARRYDASKRREKAKEARARVLSAASQLFSKRGIDAVSFAEIAEKAGVSTASLYAQFRSKAGLLEALTHSILLGPSYETAAKQAERLDDPEEALRLTAAMACGIYQREHAEMGLIRGAAAYSPSLKKLEAGLEKIRRDLQEERARLIYRSNPALAELGLEKVRDVIWLYTSRDLYRMLVLERGWTSEEYERWLAGALIRTLLNKEPEMSFQAYLDNIKEKTGHTPEEFKKLAKKAGILKPDLKATEFIGWLARDFGLGRGHAMALWAVFKGEGWVAAPKK